MMRGAGKVAVREMLPTGKRDTLKEWDPGKLDLPKEVSPTWGREGYPGGSDLGDEALSQSCKLMLMGLVWAQHIFVWIPSWETS